MRVWLTLLSILPLCASGCAWTENFSNPFAARTPQRQPSHLDAASTPGQLAALPRKAEDDNAGIWAMARLSERRGHTEQAREAYLAMIQRKADDYRPYHRLAVLNAQTGNWQDAEQYFQQAMARNQSDPELLGDAGYYYYLTGNTDQAEQLLSRAAELDPNSTKHVNNLAILLGEQGRDEDCLALFRRNGNDAEAFANLGYVLAQRGDFDRAVQAYSQALSIDSSLQPAAEAMVQLARYLPAEKRPTGYIAADATADLNTRIAQAATRQQAVAQNSPARTGGEQQTLAPVLATATKPTPKNLYPGKAAADSTETGDVRTVNYVTWPDNDPLQTVTPIPFANSAAAFDSSIADQPLNSATSSLDVPPIPFR